MNHNTYDAYVFDLYGTLADIRTREDKPALWRKMAELYASLGAPYSPGQLQESYERKVRLAGERVQAAGVKQYGPDFLGEPDLTEVFRALYRERGVSCGRERAAMTANVFRMLSRQKLKVYDGVKETLEALRRAGKGVYLLSNAQSDFTRPEIELLGLAPCFDGILISSEEGCRKPSPVFFRRLRERYGLEPKQCLMTGNDGHADILGAKAAGMDTLYLHTETSPAYLDEWEATYVVPDGDWRRAAEILLGTAER